MQRNRFHFIKFIPALVFACFLFIFPFDVHAEGEKAVSILGDSISNYADTAPTYYNIAYPNDDVDDVNKTWWMRTINDLGYKFCMDDAASGSRITPYSGDTTGKPAFIDRLNDLSSPDGTTPDVILVMGGTNDLKSDEPADLETFRSSYDELLKKIDEEYPDADVVCLTILPVFDYDWDTESYNEYVNPNGKTADDFNDVIREVAADNNIPVIDTYDCGITLENCSDTSIDGTHPKNAGMQLIAKTVESALPRILSHSLSDAISCTVRRSANIANRKSREQYTNSKKYSVLGDSISTFEETLPEGYHNQYPYGDLTEVTQTWWNRAFTALGYTRCMNDSAAGSRVCGDVLEDGESPCFISNRRIMDLTTGDNASPSGEVPGIILVFGGTNDQAQNQSKEDFEKAYGVLLKKLKAYYPDSQVVCMTAIEHADQDSDKVILQKQWLNKAGESVQDFNEIIKKVADENGVPYIDTYNCGIDVSNAGQYTVEGLHPNAAGAGLIADYVIANLPTALVGN